MIPTVDNLLAFSSALAGKTLTTLHRRKSFTVFVTGDTIEITPGTGNVRNADRKYLGALLERMASTHSFRPSDYIDVTFNASYMLALVKLWQDRRACNLLVESGQLREL